MLNTSELLISLSPFESNSSSVFEPLEDDQEFHITQDEYDTIRPYIDEDELRELGPKARLHIIASALACHSDIGQSDTSNHLQEVSHCPRIFDGWTCWDETPVGETAYAACPWFVTGFEYNRIAHKECLHDGSWFRHPISNWTWSNYTNCVDYEILHVSVREREFSIPGWIPALSGCAHSIAIYFLSLSIAIMHSSNDPQTPVCFVYHQQLVMAGVVYCAVTHILTHYFLMANYFWMFCEGFYLHTLLVVYSFSRGESKLLKWFYVFGWLGPLLPIGLYTTFRATDADPIETKECWIHNSKWKAMITLPVAISLLVSLVFVINIVRVLVVKFNLSVGESGPSTDSAGSLKKATRATLILIPLLGLHFLIIPLRPNDKSTEWKVVTYEYVTAFSSSFQGLVVSLMFCFFNGEVLAVLKGHIFGTSSTCGGKLLGNMRTNTTYGNSRVNSQSMPSSSTTTTAMQMEMH
ncbi:Calcitonin-like peptide type 1 receptor [Orchesella cincta]|uniref:Calcitonin-like peptide type 1 receptor n=1 Tax=Orchesella cincta TaxID=48709 RepID=A0A1D2M6E6_ORCCI|nr:Calcitonin-like peptide type 1 receptor [Orchesella cincta]